MRSVMTMSGLNSRYFWEAISPSSAKALSKIRSESRFSYSFLSTLLSSTTRIFSFSGTRGFAPARIGLRMARNSSGVKGFWT